MPKRSSRKQESDLNENAARVVGRIISMAEDEPPAPPEKNAAAVELGRRGGLKGGKARAASLNAEQRSDIARKAAQTRWKKNGDR